MKHPEKLDIIDEQENIIDQTARDEVHIKGLLHREVHVWLYTPDNKIIFQKRSATKDTFPNLLDASVGGHVDLGETPEIASIKELEEEAGIKADISELNFIDKKRSNSTDPQTGKINNVIRYVYSYLYEGDITDLTLEEGKGDGFVAYSIS
jgi:isopentenyldiphosphate isomerase